MESRRGRRHAYENLDPAVTALVVVDMVPFFVDANPHCQTAAVAMNNLARQLRSLGGDINTVLIVGTVTNVCCESSVRDA